MVHCPRPLEKSSKKRVVGPVVKVAMQFLSPVITTWVTGFVPEQSPDQLLKFQGADEFAVSVTTVPLA
jgi:hypothetical protein